MVNNRVAVIRADASDVIGGGHIIRTMALADGLEKNGWDCFLATAKTTVSLFPDISNRIKVIELDCAIEDEADILLQSIPDKASWLIVDHYQWTYEMEQQCRSRVEKILVIDDMATRKHDCEVLLDQTYLRHASEYSDKVEASCQLLLGSEYALLREQFSSRRDESLNRHTSAEFSLNKILISFGMSDTDSAIRYALEEINNLNMDVTIEIIGKRESLSEVIDPFINSLSIVVHEPTPNIAELLESSDLMIGAAGVSSWERCCLAVPGIVIILADNQKQIAQVLEQSGAINIAGHINQLKPSALTSLLKKYMQKPSILREMAESASRICDGLGVMRTVDFMDNYV